MMFSFLLIYFVFYNILRLGAALLAHITNDPVRSADLVAKAVQCNSNYHGMLLIRNLCVEIS
jgi:hypothetical protein